MLATVTSRPQLQAILGKMERQARDDWGRAPSAVAPGRCVRLCTDFRECSFCLGSCAASQQPMPISQHTCS